MNERLNEFNQECGFCEPKEDKFMYFDDYGKEGIFNFSILETGSIFVKSDVLPSHPDGLHMLIIPKRHRYAFVDFPELWEEVPWVIARLEEKFNAKFAFFEHGNTRDHGKIQSVYHAHAHLINTDGYDVIRYMGDVLRQLQIEFQIFVKPEDSPILNIRTLFKNLPYLFIQQGRRMIIAHDESDGDPTDGFPSLITQGSMSQFYGRRLNWKKIGDDPELARISVQRITRLLERCRGK